MEKKFKYQSKGITLISLIVTIIVLLILAGVSIAVLTGENGILNRATEAKQTSEEKTEEEKLKLGVLALSTEYRSKTTHTEDEDKFSKFVNKEANKNKLATELGVSSSAIEVNTASDILTYRTKQYKLDTLGGIGEYVPPSFTGLSATGGDAALPEGVTEVTFTNVANENLKDTTKIKAVIKGSTLATGTGEVPIPVNAKYKEGTEQTGVVIEYKGSEFVWVPVPVAIKTSSELVGTTGPKPMAKVSTATGYASGDNTNPNYEGVFYDFSGSGESVTSQEKTSSYGQGTESYREPEKLSNFDTTSYDYLKDIGFVKNNQSDPDAFLETLISDYKKMVESVAKYGGFFVGRYETSIDSETVVASKKSTETTTIMPMTAADNSQMWYGMYDKQRKFSGINPETREPNGDNLVSSMIWGSQYDAMLNWMLTGSDDAKTRVSANTYGNHNNTGAVGCGTYNSGSDKINNIYDLEGNVFEVILEAVNMHGANLRIFRGGSYDLAFTPSDGVSGNPNYTDAYLGSRLSLYIK